jgi:hypothetical protein
VWEGALAPPPTPNPPPPPPPPEAAAEPGFARREPTPAREAQSVPKYRRDKLALTELRSLARLV